MIKPQPAILEGTDLVEFWLMWLAMNPDSGVQINQYDIVSIKETGSTWKKRSACKD